MHRDLIGYGGKPPQINWPQNAKLAVNFVINYEEGSERSPLYHDKEAESYGGEFSLPPKPSGMRHLGMESLFEYGSRAGIWRLLRLFDAYAIPLTFFANGMALQANPVLCEYLANSQHEIAGHGWRWLDHSLFARAEEKKQIRRCINVLKDLTGQSIQGWYSGRSSENTRDLLREIGGFLYDSDSYADDVPYFIDEHLIIPYNLDCNDFRFCTTPGFASGTDFYEHLINSFNYLYEEKLCAIMTIGLHPRFSGRPGRTYALKQFVEHIRRLPDIWITRRVDIAQYWRKVRQSKQGDNHA